MPVERINKLKFWRYRKSNPLNFISWVLRCAFIDPVPGSQVGCFQVLFCTRQKHQTIMPSLYLTLYTRVWCSMYFKERLRGRAPILHCLILDGKKVTELVRIDLLEGIHLYTLYHDFLYLVVGVFFLLSWNLDRCFCKSGATSIWTILREQHMLYGFPFEKLPLLK